MKPLLYLPELAELTPNELSKLIDVVKQQPNSPAKESLLKKLTVIQKLRTSIDKLS